MNSAIVYIKNSEVAALANKSLSGKKVLESLVEKLSEVTEKVYVIGNTEETACASNKNSFEDVAVELDEQGKCLIVSPLYPYVETEDYKALLDKEDCGAVVTDGENIVEIFMIPNSGLNSFENLSFKTVELSADKVLSINESTEFDAEEEIIEERKMEELVIEGVEEIKSTPENTVIFGLSANNDLVDETCKYLGIQRGSCDVKHFADGETLVQLNESVRGKSVFVIQSTCRPVNERLMEVLIAVDALKRASAKEITCVIPYFGYARQDRKASPRQPITSKLVADLLVTAGANRVVTFNLHAAQIQGFFDVPVDELTTIPMIGKYFLSKDLDKDNLVVVSPDHGGVTRARDLAQILDVPIAIIDKRRPRPNEVEAKSVIGDVVNKNVIIIDDICDTGGSLVAACNILRDHGANDIYVCCIHGVLSGDAVERIENSPMKEFVITNTIPLNDKQKEKTTKIKVLSIAWMLAKLIEAISNERPVSHIYELFKQQ